MRWRKIGWGRKVIITLAASLGIPAVFIDTMSRFRLIESWLSPAWAQYLPVFYLASFVVGMVVLGTVPDDDADVASLHQANTRLQNTIAEQNDKILALERDAPRHLKDDARRIITERLRPMVAARVATGRQAAIQVTFMPGGDCASLSLEFEDLLTSIGFEIIHAKLEMTLANYNDDYRRGIYITQDKEQDIKYGKVSFGDTLYEALLESKIAATKLDRPGPGCSLCLIVGART